MTSSVFVAKCIDKSVDQFQPCEQFLKEKQKNKTVALYLCPPGGSCQTKTPTCSWVAYEPLQRCKQARESPDSQKQTYRYEDAQSAYVRERMTDVTPVRLHNS